ncbi:MAG: BamA/TamA family outer membrane protein [Ignavibacteriales bacterium]|nr:BamA/TamA family outer membrane protein [Ignavibacteriales bacterium]
MKFQGNNILNADQLSSVVRTRQTPWAFWKFMYRIVSEKIGEKPEYFDPATFVSDFAQVQQLYKEQGFYASTVDTAFQVDVEARTIGITFLIKEGARSFIDSIEYKGLAQLPSDLQEEINEGQLIKLKDPSIIQNVSAEVRRLASILENNGYVEAKVHPPSVRHYASTNNVAVAFTFQPGPRYQFGAIEVRQDSTVKEQVDRSIILRHLDFAQGDFYGESKKVESERNLNRLGIFEASKIENKFASVSPANLDIPIVVQARPRPFQELTPEVGLNDQNNAFNLLFGIGYSHRNFFGGARNFSTRLRFNLQSVGGFDLSRLVAKDNLRDTTIVYKLEATTQLVQPYFIDNKTTISATLSGVLDKRKDYYIPIYRGRVGVTSQAATYTRTFYDWELEWIDPILISTLQSTSAVTIGGTRLYERQFNSILTATIQRDKRNDIFSPTQGFFHSLSVEESGLLPKMFGGLFGTHLPYAQYVKIAGLAQWYWDASNRKTVIWAARLHAGAAQMYGDSPTGVPITRRFFVGGSSSVRGWRARDLGAVPNKEEGGTAIAEANIEARWNLFQGSGSLWFIELDKIGLVFFYDIGNVWSAPAKIRTTEFAMASGFGFRYNTIAGPIRIDFGLRVYDPQQTTGGAWITQRKFFTETLSSMVFHIGILHAF